ncbi:MAG: hypothetical protein V4607_08200 [Pseudomonadota bacterium]
MDAFKTSKAVLMTALLIGASVSMAACSKEETPVEKVGDKVGDALNMRDHEKLKDAGEDAKDAAGNAVEGVKEEAKKVTE